MSAYVDAIAAHLLSESLAGGSTGWAIHRLKSQDSPDQNVTIYETGGQAPEQATDRTFRQPSFQIAVRGARDDSQAASEKAEAILVALDRATIAGFDLVRATQSTPFSAGSDANHRPLFTVNFRAGES